MERSKVDLQAASLMRRSGAIPVSGLSRGEQGICVSKDLNAIISAIEAHVQRLHTEIAPLERGEVRHASRPCNGAWQDRTEQAIHDRRNLLATLESLLVLIRQPR